MPSGGSVVLCIWWSGETHRGHSSGFTPPHQGAVCIASLSSPLVSWHTCIQVCWAQLPDWCCDDDQLVQPAALSDQDHGPLEEFRVYSLHPYTTGNPLSILSSLNEPDVGEGSTRPLDPTEHYLIWYLHCILLLCSLSFELGC